MEKSMEKQYRMIEKQLQMMGVDDHHDSFGGIFIH
jgi:hypothetical protein